MADRFDMSTSFWIVLRAHYWDFGLCSTDLNCQISNVWYSLESCSYIKLRHIVDDKIVVNWCEQFTVELIALGSRLINGSDR